MFNSPILDVAIGMIFVYLLLSLLATAAQEVIASQNRERGKLLKQAISKMLYDDVIGYTLSSKFYSHPIIKKFAIEKKSVIPSYIADETFVQVLKEILPHQDAQGTLVISDDVTDNLKQRILLLPDGEMRRLLLNFLGSRKYSESVDEHIKRFDQAIIDWFNATMERASGFYKRSTQKNLLIMGFLFAVCVNADSLRVYSVLSKDKAAREKIVQQAIQYVDDHPDSAVLSQNAYPDTALRNDITKQFKQVLSDSNYLEVDETLGMGWKREKQWMWLPAFDYHAASFFGKIGWALEVFFMNLVRITWIIPKLLGWLLTAFAITLGAPFWFDMLKRVINIRGSGTKPPVTQDDGTKKMVK